MAFPIRTFVLWFAILLFIKVIWKCIFLPYEVYQFAYKCNSYEHCRISKVIHTAADAPEILTTGGNDDMTVNMSKQNATSCSKTEKVRVVSSMYIAI